MCLILPEMEYGEEYRSECVYHCTSSISRLQCDNIWKVVISSANKKNKKKTTMRKIQIALRLRLIMYFYVYEYNFFLPE